MTFSRFHIVLGESPIHGLGVFATKNFKKGEILEICPIISIIGHAEATLLATSAEVGEFVFETPTGNALSLGYGSFYNHSYEPNADYKVTHLESIERDCLKILAWKRIKKGDEIFINYNGDPKDQTIVFGDDGWWWD